MGLGLLVELELAPDLEGVPVGTGAGGRDLVLREGDLDGDVLLGADLGGPLALELGEVPLGGLVVGRRGGQGEKKRRTSRRVGASSWSSSLRLGVRRPLRMVPRHGPRPASVPGSRRFEKHYLTAPIVVSASGPGKRRPRPPGRARPRDQYPREGLPIFTGYRRAPNYRPE